MQSIQQDPFTSNQTLWADDQETPSGWRVMQPIWLSAVGKTLAVSFSAEADRPAGRSEMISQMSLLSEQYVFSKAVPPSGPVLEMYLFTARTTIGMVNRRPMVAVFVGLT
jgi:hypothetical protein